VSKFVFDHGQQIYLPAAALPGVACKPLGPAEVKSALMGRVPAPAVAVASSVIWLPLSSHQIVVQGADLYLRPSNCVALGHRLPSGYWLVATPVPTALR